MIVTGFSLQVTLELTFVILYIVQIEIQRAEKPNIDLGRNDGRQLENR